MQYTTVPWACCRAEASNLVCVAFVFLFGPAFAGLTLGGPQIYHLSFYLLAAGTKNTKYPRMGLSIGLNGSFLGQPALSFVPEPVPGLPGPALGPKGPESAKNPGPDLSCYSP